MMNSIPKTRLLAYFLAAGLIPVIFALAIFWSINSNIGDLQNTLEEMQQTAIIRERKQASNMAVMSHFRDADHFYIDKYLETLTFLEPEVDSLQKLLKNKNLIDDEPVKKRLDQLTSQANSLVFTEGVVQSSPIFQETTETMVHPVEVNGADLQKILARVEGVNIGPYSPSPNRPQLIILDFKIERKSINEKNEVFFLNMKLLKREYM